MGPAAGSAVPAEKDQPLRAAETERPIVLANCSTGLQNDRSIVETAVEALPDHGYFIVATTAAYDPETFQDGPHRRVDRFLPHGEIIDHARVVRDAGLFRPGAACLAEAFTKTGGAASVADDIVAIVA